MYRSLLVFGSYLAVASCALYAQDRPDFSGTWLLEGDEQHKWVIEQNAETIKLTRVGVGSDQKTDIKCSFYGQECKATINGSEAKTSFWYNGPTLVQFSYLGKDGKEVIRTRRAMSEDGKKITVEIAQIAPSPDSPRKMVFIRVPEAAEQTASAASAATPPGK